MKHNNIKRILRQQVESQTHTFWVWQKDNEGNTLEFQQIYKTVPDDATEVYSPSQLLDKIEEDGQEKS